MFHRTTTVLALVVLCASGRLTRAAESKAKKDPHAEDRTAIEKVLQTYAEAFSKQDLKAIGELWTEDGTYEDRQSGETLEGRKAILTDLEKVFKDRKGVKVSTHVSRIRFIKQDVAKVDGQATATDANGDVTTTPFVAVFTKSETGWLIASVEETAEAVPASAHEALQQLAWLVGTWKDDSPDIDVQTICRWATSGSYLIRSYTVQKDDEPTHQGTQVIGWDPRSQQYHSWVFDGDGAFGDGAWTHDGNDWLVRLSFTLRDGRLFTGTQVISKVSDTEMTVRMVGQEIDGEPVPSSDPVTVKRIQEPEKSASN